MSNRAKNLSAYSDGDGGLSIHIHIDLKKKLTSARSFYFKAISSHMIDGFITILWSQRILSVTNKTLIKLHRLIVPDIQYSMGSSSHTDWLSESYCPIIGVPVKWENENPYPHQTLGIKTLTVSLFYIVVIIIIITYLIFMNENEIKPGPYVTFLFFVSLTSVSI